MTPIKKQKRLRKKLPGSLPQDVLWHAVSSRWPEAVSEHKNAVPGRKFRIDIAFPDKMLAVEVDGWQFHAKYLESFKIDRARQNLLVVNGWRVIRFTAADVKKDLIGCINLIELALK